VRRSAHTPRRPHRFSVATRTPTKLVSFSITNLPSRLYANIRLKPTGRPGEDITQLRRVRRLLGTQVDKPPSMRRSLPSGIIQHGVARLVGEAAGGKEEKR
jgi:hypothetical protein